MRVYPDILTTPFGKSPLTFFVGQVTAELVAGNFVFDGALTSFLAPHPLVSKSLYFFWDFDYSVDAAEADYTGGILRAPLISIYESARPTQPVFRQPFPSPVFWHNKPIQQGFVNLVVPNELKFSITGLVKQTAALLSKETLVATVQFTAYEVTDQDYVGRFMEGLNVAPPPPPVSVMAPEGPMSELAKGNASRPKINLGSGLQLPA